LSALDESSAEKRVKIFELKCVKKRARKKHLPYIGVEALEESRSRFRTIFI